MIWPWTKTQEPEGEPLAADKEQGEPERREYEVHYRLIHPYDDDTNWLMLDGGPYTKAEAESRAGQIIRNGIRINYTDDPDYFEYYPSSALGCVYVAKQEKAED